MRRIAALILSIFLVSQIPAVQAATSSKTLEDLIRIIRTTDEGPATFSTEIHGGMDEMYVSLWAKGGTNGDYYNLRNTVAELAFTIDYAFGEEYARIRSELRMANGVVYFRVKEVITRNSDAADSIKAAYGDIIGQWLHIDVLEEGEDYWKDYLDEYKRIQEERDETFVKLFEPFIQIIERASGEDSTYSLSLPVSARRGFLRALMSESDNLSSPYAREMARKLLREIRVAFRSNIHLTEFDNLFSIESGIGLSTTEWYLNLRSNYEIDIMGPFVDVPVKSTSIMEFLGAGVGILSPEKPLKDAKDAQRRSDVNTILNAVYQYAIDNNGTLPAGLRADANRGYSICKTYTPCDGVSLDVLVGNYLVRLPVDPDEPSESEFTGYSIRPTAEGILVVAPNADPFIEVFR